MNRSEEDEQTNPIPDGTVCRAECTFSAEFPHDLPFEEGDTLTIIGPCNKVFWYLAEDKRGRRGVVPINHLLQVDSQAITATVALPPADRPPFPPPSEDRPPFPPPTADRPPFPPPSEDRPPFPPPSEDRPPFPPPSEDRPPLPPPTADRPPFPPPTADRPPFPTPPEDRPPLPPPTADRPPFPTPPEDRPPFPLPTADRPPFPLPTADRPSFPTPTADRPSFPTPTADRPPFPPPTVHRAPATLPTVHRAPATPPTVHRAPATPPTVHRAPDIMATSRPPSSGRTGDDYSAGERPPLPPPEQQKNAGKTATLPPSSCKYRDVLAFRAKSGWCMPSVDEVLMKKAQFANMLLFQKMRVGIYVFLHKTIANLKYVGKSYELYYELCRMFENIYSKPIHHLSPIEEQLRFYHPDASEWHLRIYSCRMDELELTLAKRIILNESLAPRGLNRELTFIGKEAWEDFCIWLVEQRKGRPSKNP